MSPRSRARPRHGGGGGGSRRGGGGGGGGRPQGAGGKLCEYRNMYTSMCIGWGKGSVSHIS